MAKQIEDQFKINIQLHFLYIQDPFYTQLLNGSGVKSETGNI
jgi:hypothetical protein